MARQRSYDVYLRGRWVDRVFYTGGTVDEVRHDLVNHDGYSPAIVVIRAHGVPATRAARTLRPDLIK